MREDVAERFLTELVEDAEDVAVITYVHDLREDATGRMRAVAAALPPDVLCAHLVENAHRSTMLRYTLFGGAPELSCADARRRVCAFDEREQVFGGEHRHAGAGFVGGAADVGDDHDVVERDERVVGR